jgi:hypothetical protein
MTPNLAVVHIHNPYWRACRIWIPLFLLWIPVVLLAPFLLLILLAACVVWRVSLWKSISVFWGILSALPGTDVLIHSEQNHVLVEIL